MGTGLLGDPATNVKISPTTGHLKPWVTERTPPQESFVSHVPLRLQIKVSGQSGSLGISIAGGRGSLPYNDHDEVSAGAEEPAGLNPLQHVLPVLLKIMRSSSLEQLNSNKYTF